MKKEKNKFKQVNEERKFFKNVIFYILLIVLISCCSLIMEITGDFKFKYLFIKILRGISIVSLIFAFSFPFYIIIKTKFKSSYKKIVVDYLNNYFPNLKYKTYYELPLELREKSCFYDVPKRVKTEDTIWGDLNGVTFISSDTFIGHLRGRLFAFQLTKRYDEYLLIFSKQNHFTKETNDIQLESVEFNQKFSVSSTNEHTIFYILTPHMIETILKIHQVTNGKVNISFNHDLFFITITNLDAFEPRVIKKVNEEYLMKQLEIFHLIEEIIDELRLRHLV